VNAEHRELLALAQAILAEVGAEPTQPDALRLANEERAEDRRRRYQNLRGRARDLRAAGYESSDVVRILHERTGASRATLYRALADNILSVSGRSACDKSVV
jgi:hypothetical protein